MFKKIKITLSSFFLITFVFSIASVNAQHNEHISWKTIAEKNNDGTITLTLSATLDKGWHLYSQHVGDAGPIATEISIKNNQGFILKDGFKEEGVIKEYDKTWEADILYFANSAVFIGILEQLSSSDTLDINIYYQICDDAQCINLEDDFRIIVGTGKIIEQTLLETNETVLNQIPKALNVDLENPVNDCGGQELDTSYWIIFILGLLGGLIALITPCVFPMIPLTVSFFTKGGSDRKSGLWKALLYGLSIIGVYVTLSIPFHFGAESEILNNISTNVYLNVFFFVIFLFFAFSFFGYYELTLPSSWANKADKASDKGGVIGIVFMALVLAIVSFSCTGPLLGSVLAGSLTSDFDPWLVTFAMFGFGLGLGLPFTLFAAFPSMLKSLPSSGGWLNNVKVVLGFVELMMALKFLSNADLVYRFGILHRETFFLLWILLSLATTIYLFGWIRFPHDTKGAKIGSTRKIIGMLFLAFAIYLAPGILPKDKQPWSSSLISGFPPPTFYSWYENNDVNDHFTDYFEALDYAQKVNKPILIDFTGWACVNCRKMEENVWPIEEVALLLKEYVVVSLYVDDRVALPEHLQGNVSIPLKNGGFKNKSIQTFGDKWTAFESFVFGQVSQPYYVLLSPDEILLTNPIGYEANEKSYANWLKCGLEAMEKINSGAYVFKGVQSKNKVTVDDNMPIKWQFDALKASNNSYDITITVDLNKGWHLYSQYGDSLNGPILTHFELENNDNVAHISPFIERGVHSEFDPIWDAVIQFFEDKALFKTTITLKSQTPTILKGIVTYMICDDQQCIPAEESFEINITP